MKCLKKCVENVWKFIKFIKTNIKLLLVVMLWLVWLVYLWHKGEKMLKIMDNNGVLAISGFVLYLVFYVPKIKEYLRQFVNNNNQLKDNTDTKLVLEEFYKKRDIKGLKKDILNIFVGYEYLDNYDKNEAQEDNIPADNRGVLFDQMQKAKLNTYNNSYLTFCLLIDRCIEIADNKEQPYCFQEIAEAFKLDWKGRRYLHYIAHSLLGTIGGLLEKENENKQDNEKIPCVNASVVTKWERDKSNEWFCNGGIKTPAWCCYPEYKQEGEDDREFILKLCKIVKDANEDKNNDKIKSWKETYYKLLTEEVKTKNEKIKQEENKFKFAKQKALDKVYEKCQNKKAKEDDNNEGNKVGEEKEDNSKPNGDNNK